MQTCVHCARTDSLLTNNQHTHTQIHDWPGNLIRQCRLSGHHLSICDSFSLLHFILCAIHCPWQHPNFRGTLTGFRQGEGTKRLSSKTEDMCTSFLKPAVRATPLSTINQSFPKFSGRIWTI
uniref:C2H2-type domain-containing protein n=1 Tax=Mesocestoides corti TaxID=53468 RepID=A0A5K3FMY5_MESCO